LFINCFSVFRFQAFLFSSLGPQHATLERYSMTIGACSSVSGERRNERKVGGLLLFFFASLSQLFFLFTV
jgi:hypothetical protein